MEIGRIHHFVLDHGISKGQCRPMIVVREWSPGYVNATVFMDGSNDGGEMLYWATSIKLSLGFEPRTWHRYQECPHAAKD